MEKLIGSNKQLTPENVDAFLKKPIITNLATINRDGSPQVTPVWHLYDGEKIRIMSASTAVKVRNIQRDARVTLSIAGHTEPYQYVLIKGNAVESYNGIWDFLIAISMHYKGESEGAKYAEKAIKETEFCILTITPIKIAGWCSGE